MLVLLAKNLAQPDGPMGRSVELGFLRVFLVFLRLWW